MGNGFVFVGRCVTRVFRAVCHAVALHYETVGFIMAKSYLPDDETVGMVDPEMREYAEKHNA